MSADIERHDFVPGPRADRCAECYQPAGHAIHGGRRPPDRRAEAAEDFHRRAVADYDPLPERWHIAGEQPAASDGDGGRSYGAAVAHQAAKQHSATGICTLAPDRPHADVGLCTACVEQGLFDTITVTPSPEMRSAVLVAAGLTDDLDDGGDDVTDALAGDELMAWRMTPRTQQVILAALEVASRLPAQRAECERVAAIVRSAGGIHCPDCGPDRYGKHGIGHAFSETGGE